MKAFWTILCFAVYVSMDAGGPSVLAMTDSHLSDSSEGGGLPPEVLQEMLWFFRREDPSTWSYCILGLSVLVLVVGLVLLGANVKANRNQKVPHLDKEGYGACQLEETEMKRAFVFLKDDSNTDPPPDSSLPKTSNAGEVSIHWKDGNVTTLYEDKPEVDI